jgi:hypothetical protein
VVRGLTLSAVPLLSPTFQTRSARPKPVSPAAGLCFKCFQKGHMVRDCPNRSLPVDRLLCTRCGKFNCKASGKGDWHRAVFGCSEEYARTDMQHVTCFVCGHKGRHCSCQEAPKVRPSAPANHSHYRRVKSVVFHTDIFCCHSPWKECHSTYYFLFVPGASSSNLPSCQLSRHNEVIRLARSCSWYWKLPVAAHTRT